MLLSSQDSCGVLLNTLHLRHDYTSLFALAIDVKYLGSEATSGDSRIEDMIKVNLRLKEE
jgi:hypothetical protein